MIEKKKLLSAILSGAMLLSLTACGHSDKKGNSDTDTQQGSAVEDTTANSGNGTGSVSPEDADIYLDDNANIISSDLRAKVDLYNANWSNLAGEVVALTVVETPTTSIDAEAERVRQNLGLHNQDSVLCVATSGDSFLSIGETSRLNEANITLNLDNGLPLADAIAAKYEEMNDFYMSSGSETASDSNTSTDSTEWDQDVKNIYDNFQDVSVKNGLIAIDVSEYNQEVYPGASIWQASDGNVSLLMVNGSDDAADYFWYFYYDKLINGAAKGKFTQK